MIFVDVLSAIMLCVILLSVMAPFNMCEIVMLEKMKKTTASHWKTVLWLVDIFH